MKLQATGNDLVLCSRADQTCTQHWGNVACRSWGTAQCRRTWYTSHVSGLSVLGSITQVLFFWSCPHPLSFVALPVTSNFSPAFYSQRFFSSNLRESRCRRSAGRPSALCGPTRSRDPTPFFLAPIHIFLFCSWNPLLYKSIQHFFFF